MKQTRLLLILLGLLAGSVSALPLSERIGEYCPDCAGRTATQTGAYILEKGEEALISRAWLAANAATSIDVQYFIWSTDNIGILAGEALLAAAERGVKVRVLVDDFLVDAKSTTLLILAAHPNVSIKIYNPLHSVGVTFWQRFKNLMFNFHGANQRMHDKAAIFDGFVGITGGRNMADEYFDYDHEYNFRDRDILLVGSAVKAMTENFEEFWASPLAVDVTEILTDPIAPIDSSRVEKHVKMLHEYAQDESNFSPQVRRLLQDLPQHFSAMFDAMQWGEVQYISDVPGKNDGTEFLAGSGEATRLLV
ncbi:MAG TPA: phospholipase D-like domain-containing protein, partial [Marinagarivorans sp.]